MDPEFKLRLYQETILNTAASSNCLVVLPTGLGKTAIAAALIKNRLQNYIGSKVIFLAPTKPLAQQHEKTLKLFLEENTILFTGSVSPEKRKKMWLENTVIISTPQGLENDVISRRINLEDVSLIVFDEAHRATGDYAYTFLAKKYLEIGKHVRILALTASPGSNKEKIMEICSNLGIEEIEYRTSEDFDVKPYVQDMDIEYVQLELPDELKKVKEYLDRSYTSKLIEAEKFGYLPSNSGSLNKTAILSLISALHGKIAGGEKEFDLLKTVSLLAEALKVQHALELVETQGIHALSEYFEQLEKQALSSNVKAVKNLVRDINFRSALVLSRKLNEENITHPKIEYLKELLKSEVDFNTKSKIIIFTQFRDSAKKIKKILGEIEISSELFVGQSKKKDTGLSQKEQKQMIEDFENEKFSCLIATSVGEEGLDIPEVDLVIFYEPVPSAIRTVQRRGRTGRQKKGRVITLLTKNTRDEGYRWAAHHKEKRMYSVLKDIKKNYESKNTKKQITLNDYSEIPTKEENCIIKVDYREKGSFVMKELLNMNVKLDLVSLEIGDYQLSEHVVVEFKTVKDFVDSIIDGRLLSQARELKKYYQPLIIIEGDEDIYAQRRIHPNAIRGMIAALIINLRIPVLYTKNPKDTAALLKLIAEREQKSEKPDYQMHSVKPFSDNELLEYVVSSFPGIGSKLAKPLLKKFGSIKKLVNSSEEELKEVDLIGEIKAKKLKELFDKEYYEKS
ncbi:DEAD/DEAH box helicase [Candidatus Woesearchaeota archaeon CG10_big_fil_rev_8_21_14_0_10_32_9]|nr:MAG: DEAD/DEAH box helicase [Candidatus Woesearchaeota archaeon CG10_big_fil_rev_8_21_14_0_10_32_9]